MSRNRHHPSALSLRAVQSPLCLLPGALAHSLSVSIPAVSFAPIVSSVPAGSDSGRAAVWTFDLELRGLIEATLGKTRRARYDNKFFMRDLSRALTKRRANHE